MEDGGSRWYEYFEEPDEYADGLLMVEIKVRVLKSNLFPPRVIIPGFGKCFCANFQSCLFRLRGNNDVSIIVTREICNFAYFLHSEIFLLRYELLSGAISNQMKE